MSTDKAVASAVALAAEVDIVIVVPTGMPTCSEVSTIDDSCFSPTVQLATDLKNK
jgi:hypothetical protein